MAEVKVKPDEKMDEPEEDYNKKMIDKAEGKTDEPDNTSKEDQLLAGKYKSEEDLQKGVLEALKKSNGDKSLEEIYKELESSIGKQEDPEPEDTDNDLEIKKKEKETKKVNTDPDVMNKYYDELRENGELSEDSYSELEDLGYPKHFIDNYVRGLKAEADSFSDEVFGVVDGKENYNKVVSWAEDNLSEAEIETFNEGLASGNISQAKMMVEALNSRYINSEGKQPNLVEGKNPSTTVDAYESKEQLMEAMRDPRYSKDPAYRKKVTMKLSKSNIF